VNKPRRRRRRTDDQLVIDALTAVAAGAPYRRVARDLGVAVSTLRRWCRRAGIVRGMHAVEFMP
jgi:transposase-like protein